MTQNTRIVFQYNKKLNGLKLTEFIDWMKQHGTEDGFKRESVNAYVTIDENPVDASGLRADLISLLGFAPARIIAELPINA